MKQKRRPQFPGLALSTEDRVELGKLKRDRALGERQWRRLRTLEMLDQGRTLAAVADALGTYPREVRRVGWRYLEQGLEAALREDQRYLPPPMLDDRQKAEVIAIACSEPPSGRARWTMVLIAKEATRRKIVKVVSRETVRRTLADHDLKPWREKNVVRSRTG